MSPVSTQLLRTQSDARLMRLAADGYERAFEVLVARYHAPLRRYCRRLLSESLSEDVAQQAFLHLWSALRDGSEIREVRAWLYRVAHNAALNTVKRAGYRYEQIAQSAVGGEAPEAALERSEAVRVTLAGMAALPEHQREALVRTVLNGQSRARVAHDLGVSDGAVGQLLHRARTTLRAAMTAVTPLPLVAWAAGRHDGSTTARVIEIAGTGGGAGAAGAAGIVAKGSAVVIAAGVLAASPAIRHSLGHRDAPASPSASLDASTLASHTAPRGAVATDPLAAFQSITLPSGLAVTWFTSSPGRPSAPPPPGQPSAAGGGSAAPAPPGGGANPSDAAVADASADSAPDATGDADTDPAPSSPADGTSSSGDSPPPDPTSTDPTATDATATDTTSTDTTSTDPTSTDPTATDPTTTDPTSTDASSSPPVDTSSGNVVTNTTGATGPAESVAPPATP